MSKNIICIIVNCIISLILLFGILNGIILDDSTIDEYKEGSVTNSDSTFLDGENKLRYQIDYLSQTNISSESLLDRKENAAWVAFALYLSALVFFIYYQPLKKNKRKDLSYCRKILAVLILGIIAIISFAFIHAQYSSIYETHAKKYASNILILRLIDSGKPIDSLEKEFKYQFEFALDHEVSNYRGEKHPLHIIKDLVFWDWAKSGERNSTSQNTQEASIYLIMLLFNTIIVAQIFEVEFLSLTI